MYTTIFEFETKEDASILIGLISDTLLEWNAKDNKVFIHEDLEEDADHNKENYDMFFEHAEIYVSSWVEDNTERESLTEYETEERFY